METCELLAACPGSHCASLTADTYHLSVLRSALWQPRPQILASIGQLEFFYDQAPMVMRSCSMALQLLSVCIGSYLSGALVYAVGRWCACGRVMHLHHTIGVRKYNHFLRGFDMGGVRVVPPCCQLPWFLMLIVMN